MPMHNPPHPAEILREDVLPELDMTVTALAERLGFSRVQMSKVINGRASITADMAYRLELANIGRARHWLAMQSAYDLWQAAHREQPRIEPIVWAHA
ncbi:XRE family transcriptional regulator [Pseudomonas taeanensis MS-3]|uniref:XRE family transcriptional regulator n=1 Tax=Pseudomonas taeanensis MS-3 TaxID=1395571 RepID=A0A0A1YEB3_9PSED|nr:HigA family addiction module antitoxin [Pseudomonas taeanensis]KFX68137.1 XRE family transcriptional regulator [Pseudomonas taeanensis MS-3]